MRILLVDDHFMVRVGLAGSLSQEHDMEVVGMAGTAEEGLEAWRQTRPDVSIIDGQLPDRHGIELTRQIISVDSSAKIILLSVDETEEDIYRGLAAGAKSYLSKTTGRQELLVAIREIASGKEYLPEDIRLKLSVRESREGLTPRELDVLSGIVQGLANKQIAAALGLAEVTVKVHVSSILVKLKVTDRTNAAIIALQRGLIRP